MTRLNTFESAFMAADKPVFVYESIGIDRILLVTDQAKADAEALVPRLRQFLAAVDSGRAAWTVLGEGDFNDVQALLERVEQSQPDLILTWRHLRSDAWRWPFSLGEYLDVLLQATTTPVLILPHPEAGRALPHSVKDTDRVVAMTDHLAGDSRLINYALAFTQAGGACWLTHVESDHDFERYMGVIAKIQSIETENAREAIRAQLLKEPHDFIRRCRAAIEAEGLPVRIEEQIVMGHRLSEYRELIESHEADLLVTYAKDKDQLAMHGRTYPLAVELRQIPLLML